MQAIGYLVAAVLAILISDYPHSRKPKNQGQKPPAQTQVAKQTEVANQPNSQSQPQPVPEPEAGIIVGTFGTAGLIAFKLAKAKKVKSVKF